MLDPHRVASSEFLISFTTIESEVVEVDVVQLDHDDDTEHDAGEDPKTG